ncbi:hypothetical protein PPL_11952 [Heterostelium album PN500]|uniref:Uncharacterized protein n=1 Tax=Heterostelium pallidum (strain ATCC 26659 / Pp 5 / PN500) TaxID=670386 RepID=D3BUY0_HETP5|nr:hypothetical protein PPL_11952 [Heterostelium album PN500]EFA74918.1 hypothetical protein PPL_11952 [Heterostelium album PN500]|eukprot:XP_020427052.1 hypothetical protein PPL_11952 [Heterostelium album PN500]
MSDLNSSNNNNENQPATILFPEVLPLMLAQIRSQLISFSLTWRHLNTIESIEFDIIKKIEAFTQFKYRSLDWILRNISIPIDKLVLYLQQMIKRLPYCFELHDLLNEYIDSKK